MGNRKQDALRLQGTEELHFLLVAGGAEPAAFTGEGQHVVLLTVVATDTRKAVFQIPAVQKLVHHLGNDGAQKAMTGLVAFLVDRLHPYHLLAYHGNWYLLAYHEAKSRVATFALSRFREITGAGESFRRAPDFDARAYAREAFGITRGEKILRVRLLFEPKLAVYIVERDWHPSQQFTRRPDGRLEMRMETSGRQELIRWVLSWMPDVRVLAPKSLKDRVEEKLRDGLAQQRGIGEISTSSSSGQAAEP